MHIKGGEKFNIEVTEGGIILKPVVNITIPKNQAWFWTPEIQRKVKEAEDNFSKANFKRYEDYRRLDKRPKGTGMNIIDIQDTFLSGYDELPKNIKKKTTKTAILFESKPQTSVPANPQA